MTDPGRVVFLSYASQDAHAAQRICEALRAAAIEVFLDQSELRGGDAWDQKIRQEIHDCALFVPLISAHSDARHEGYFRREWKLAVDRTADMSDRVAFLVPVVIDDTSDSRADVPERFRQVQWTRLPEGETPPAFVERIKRLLSQELSPLSAVSGAAPGLREPVRASRRSKPALLAIVAVVLAALGYFVADKFWISKHLATSTAFNPPPYSVAVLPFVNMSGDPKEDYFSDGLSEELLNSLAAVRKLEVAARTSAFSFKGKQVDVAEIARKLNVGAVLEGSVRKEGEHVRITAQLINGVTGFHLWSKTYDRDMKGVLKLETEVATEVSAALKATLLAGADAPLDSGGTDNPQAFDAYLRAERLISQAEVNGAVPDYVASQSSAIKEFSEAIRLDPRFANAYVSEAYSLIEVQRLTPDTAVTGRKAADDALVAARQGIVLAPRLGRAHAALAEVLARSFFDFSAAAAEYERALELSPGDARVLTHAALFLGQMGRFEQALPHAQRAAALDPLNADTQFYLADFFDTGHRYQESIQAIDRAMLIDPQVVFGNASKGIEHLKAGNPDAALRLCTLPPLEETQQFCLALVYGKLHRQSEAQAAVAVLLKAAGSAFAYQYAEIYAQWGDRSKALEWLETAYRLRDAGLVYLKTDALMDPLRQEPRLQAIERGLKFPT